MVRCEVGGGEVGGGEGGGDEGGGDGGGSEGRGVTCWMACDICEPNFCRLPTNSELASADVVVAAGGSAAAGVAVLAESMGR